MNPFALVAVLLTLAALFAYLNYRFLHLPSTIGIMALALASSVVVVALHRIGLVDLEAPARQLLASVDFETTLLEGMLAFLLFAGALHVDLASLREHGLVIGTLATVGTVLSTLVVGGMVFAVMHAVGLPVSLIACLLFGALISPTDPIAVLGVLKTLGVPEELRVEISGESLFNDGVGVVVFLLIVELAYGTEPVTAGNALALLATEALGGIGFGLAAGYLCYRMLRQVDDYAVEVLLTLALVTGGYALAMALHVSAPLAIVVAGLIVGNHGRAFAMSERTRQHLDTFWEMMDEILNAVLFMLIGLEVLVVRLELPLVAFAILAVPIVLLARAVSVLVPMAVLKPFKPERTPGAKRVLIWGGLRGGISVALALSLPPGPERDAILAATYTVVLFSILVQGTTLKRLVQRVVPTGVAAEETHRASALPPQP